MNLNLLLPLFLAVAMFPSLAAASSFEEVKISGFIGVDTRFFTQNSQFPGQKGNFEISLIINPEFRVESKNGNHKFSFIPFARIDSRDGARSHFDIREAYWLVSVGDFEILTGFNRVFWGVAESRHLVNIINQSDGVEDLDQEDYLGQPMINITTFQDFGTIDLFILPGFRERTFPGSEGRFRGLGPEPEGLAPAPQAPDDEQPGPALRDPEMAGRQVVLLEPVAEPLEGLEPGAVEAPAPEGRDVLYDDRLGLGHVSAIDDRPGRGPEGVVVGPSSGL